MFDEDGSEKNPADTTIEVKEIAPNECSDYDTNKNACESAPEDCSWCPLNNNCEQTADIDCTTSACIGNFICSDTCKLSECGIKQECINNVCEAIVNECSYYDGDENACLNALEVCGWCPLNNQCEPSDEIECNDASCYGDSVCLDTCILSECSTDKECVNNVCEIIDDNDTNDTTCSTNWVCDDWSPAICPSDTKRQTRTCTDSNGCESAKTDSKRCRTTKTTTNRTTTSRSRTITPTNQSTTYSRNSRTVTPDDDTTKTSSRSSSRSTNPSTTTSTGGKRESGNTMSTDEPKTADEMLEDNAKTADILFYVLLGVLIIMLLIIGIYYKRKGLKFNRPGKVNLSKEKDFVQKAGIQDNSQQNIKYRPF